MIFGLERGFRDDKLGLVYVFKRLCDALTIFRRNGEDPVAVFYLLPHDFNCVFDAEGELQVAWKRWLDSFLMLSE